jgi:hypothetical protein
MHRPCQRAYLEGGLKLDLNRLARRGFIRPGAVTGTVGIRWWNSYFEEETASSYIRAHRESVFRESFADSIPKVGSHLTNTPRDAINGEMLRLDCWN